MASRERAFKVVVFDMDCTLVKEESGSGRKSTATSGTLCEARRALRGYAEGKITYGEFVRRNIACWPKPLRISEVKRILLNYKLTDGAIEVVGELKKTGLKVAIVTAGIDILANDVALRVGVDVALANGPEVDIRGYLTGDGIESRPLRKDLAPGEVARMLGAAPGGGSRRRRYALRR